MKTIVPREVSHVFAMVTKAKRFSILPKAFEQESTPIEMHRYLIACNALLKDTLEVAVLGMKWFHDNPRFTDKHAALETRLNNAFERRTVSGGRFGKDVNFQELDFLWTREDLQGILQCVVLMEFKCIPNGLVSIFESSTGPFVVQGANDSLRSAIARAKRIAESEGMFALFIRGDETEVYATGELLAELFVQAYRTCQGEP